jgi:hypothetical protein
MSHALRVRRRDQLEQLHRREIPLAERICSYVGGALGDAFSNRRVRRHPSERVVLNPALEIAVRQLVRSM